jgi:hypothetical protein
MSSANVDAPGLPHHLGQGGKALDGLGVGDDARVAGALLPGVVAPAVALVEQWVAVALGARLVAQALAAPGHRASAARSVAVSNIAGVLSKALADAEPWGLVNRNVARVARPPAGAQPR